MNLRFKQDADILSGAFKNSVATAEAKLFSETVFDHADLGDNPQSDEKMAKLEANIQVILYSE